MASEGTRFEGVAVAPGVALGPAHVRRPRGRASRRRVDHPVSECARLEQAIQRSRSELEETAATLRERGSDAAFVFDAHLLMHGDAMLVDAALARIRSERCNAEWAVHRVVEELKAPLERSESAYLRERAADIEQVGRHIVQALSGRTELPPPMNSLLVVHELSPALATELLGAEGVCALVSEKGTASSHAALLARALGLPAVVGVGPILEHVSDGDRLLVDGFHGVVHREPSKELTSAAQSAQAAYLERVGPMYAKGTQPASTRDGEPIQVAVNLELPEEAAHAEGAEGVGLFRTEFLFLRSPSLPDEASQFASYLRVVEAGLGPVTFRALDLGADKIPSAAKLAPSPNPALGLRSTRLLLQRPDLFEPQLRAVLRAASHGSARLMFPFVSTVGEFLRAREACERVWQGLEAEGIDHAKVPLGVMIEVPSAAIDVQRFAEVADFLSVGTNDLAQFHFARGRSDISAERPRELFCEPSFLRLLEPALNCGVPTCVCGDMAADPFGVVLLVGLGARHLSVPPPLMPLVRECVRSFEVSKARSFAEEACELVDAASVLGGLVAAFPDVAALSPASGHPST